MPKTAKKQKAAKPAVRRVKQTVFFSALKSEVEKLSPQAAAIVTTLNETGRITRKELIATLKTKLESTQEPSRVLSYYKKGLVNSRFIKVEKEVVEKVEKVAKTPAAPAAAPAEAPPAPAPVASATPSAPANT